MVSGRFSLGFPVVSPGFLMVFQGKKQFLGAGWSFRPRGKTSKCTGLIHLIAYIHIYGKHSPQCTFGCKLHSYFFVGNTLIGLRDLALWFTVPTSSKFKDHDIKTDVTVVTCLKNLNVNYMTPGIGLHRALVSIRLCQYGCYICVVIFFGWTCCWMYWKAWALVPCISRECETQLTSLQCETRASSEQVSILSRFPWRFPKEHLLVDLVVCRVTFLQRSWTLVHFNVAAKHATQYKII